MNATLYQALIIDLPPCSSPIYCIRTDATHVNSIVQGLLTLSQEFEHARFDGNDMIYRVGCGSKFLSPKSDSIYIASDRLRVCAPHDLHHQSQVVWFTISHSACDLIPNIISLLDEFIRTLQQWKTWDSITIIQNHQLIKDHLWDLFQRGLKVEVCF
jgi:hypothetical protein